MITASHFSEELRKFQEAVNGHADKDFLIRYVFLKSMIPMLKAMELSAVPHFENEIFNGFVTSLK